MSTSDTGEDTNNDSQQQPWDVLADHNGINIDEKFVLKLTKGIKNVNKEVKNSSKVLHFSSEWNFEEIISTINGLNPKEYPQLFIFIIKIANFGLSAEHQEDFSDKFTKIQESLQKFSVARPIILQLTSEDENVSKIYYKEEASIQFNTINQQQNESNEFSSFLHAFLNENFNDFESYVVHALPQFQNRLLILRFLRTLNLSDGFFGAAVLDIATEGTKAEFLAALDSPFDCNGRILNNRAQKYISVVFGDDDPANDDSVLLTAVQHSNQEIVDYLITYWTHLIQQLPVQHQVNISTAAFVNSQLDVLCDLLDIADFPFPTDFKVASVNNERLIKINAERNDFKAAIEKENFEKIDEFTSNNLNLKFIYSPSNNSALSEAVNLKKFAVFYYLKSLGFEGKECDEILKELPEEDRKQAVQHATYQRRENIKKSLPNVHRSVLKLSMQSFIHNRRISKKQEAEYRPKIMQWFIDIHKVAPEMLDVAASCNHLKIIFDFESNTVENASLAGSNALGSTYPIHKWIFVGAKLSDKNREQMIKGVLAHELCHYVMRLVYENQENPYYMHRMDMKEMFMGIVKIIDKWSANQSVCPNDECNGIISTVFTLYSCNDFHLELIVRVVHILTEYDNNEGHSIHLREKYQVLFKFWQDHVIPELQNYLLKNNDVIKLNESIGLLEQILKYQIGIIPGKDIQSIIDSKLVIVSTNMSKLLLIDICKHSQEKFGNLMDSKNLFIEPEKLKNSRLWREHKQICFENLNLNIFVDFSEGASELLEIVFINKELNFIFVVSNEQKCEELVQICKQKELKNATKMEINYNWNDLTDESKNSLLKTKINFQNNSQISLMDLLKNEKSGGIIDQDLSQIINVQILNVLLDDTKQISINSIEKDDMIEKYFDFLFQPRKFVKKTEIIKNYDSMDEEDEPRRTRIQWYKGRKIKSKTPEKTFTKIKIQKLPELELLSEVKNQRYVLISDQAGNGKSWAMRNLTKIIREKKPTSWVTYVDLKLFIDKFNAQEGEPEFSTFIIEKILKLKHNFEAKIFQKMYEVGKVFIIFDGFDEIAPNCAEFVSKLSQNFQSNGGNQLWIATRDYFSIDLKTKLLIEIPYSLDEMTVGDGVNLITSSWVFMDLKGDNNEPKSKEDFKECIKKSPKYESYQQKARQIIKKALISKNNSVGLPQLFKMIADGFKDEKNVGNLQGSEIYVKFIDILYTRWADEKGQIRKRANVKSQRFQLNFYKFHQYRAILSLFPELAAILFPGYDGSEWPEEEVIACGILTLINGKIYFIHETFREYFIVDAMEKALKKPEPDEKFVELFAIVLTVRQFKVIRIFLNEIFSDTEILKGIQPQVEKYVEKFNEMTSFDDFFTGNLNNLVDFVLEVLMVGDYEKVFEILYNTTRIVTTVLTDPKLFQKFQEFIFDFLDVDDLKYLITEHFLFHEIISSSLDTEIFGNFLIKTKEKTNPEFVSKGLLMVLSHEYETNIFHFLKQSKNLSVLKVQNFLEIVDEFLKTTEIFNLVNHCVDGRNIFHYCFDYFDPDTEKVINNKDNLKILWTGLENYFTFKETPQKFKELIKQRDRNSQNILHSAASCEFSEDLVLLWGLLLKTFDDREELKDFILQKDKWGCNFVHALVTRNDLSIVKSTFEILKQNFSEAQFQEILKSKGKNEMNLLQAAAHGLVFIEVLQFLWNFFQDCCENDEKFLEMLKDVDNCEQKNILHITAESSLNEQFEFMIQELEKIATRCEIREMLRNSDKENKNLLQIAFNRYTSSELHESLWKTLRKYFEKSEILEIIKHADEEGNNVLFNAVERTTIEIIELTWNEIKSFMNYDEQVEYLKIKGKDGKQLFECTSYNEYSSEYENKKHRKEVNNWVKNLQQAFTF